jgi:hypothetical protein
VNDIEVVRANIPYMWIDPIECEYLVDMFYSYSKEWDTKLGAWKPTPLHDEWSNAADAVRYMVMGYDGNVGQVITKPRKKQRRRRIGANRTGRIAV